VTGDKAHARRQKTEILRRHFFATDHKKDSQDDALSLRSNNGKK
jgi:hypothetical protein